MGTFGRANGFQTKPMTVCELKFSRKDTMLIAKQAVTVSCHQFQRFSLYVQVREKKHLTEHTNAYQMS